MCHPLSTSPPSSCFFQGVWKEVQGSDSGQEIHRDSFSPPYPAPTHARTFPSFLPPPSPQPSEKYKGISPSKPF